MGLASPTIQNGQMGVQALLPPVAAPSSEKKEEIQVPIQKQAAEMGEKEELEPDLDSIPLPPSGEFHSHNCFMVTELK